MLIETLDLDFQDTPQTIASFLLHAPEGPVLVEAGPGSTLENLVARLDARGIAPRDVKHVLLTHIHLDHAGAAGWWAQQGATIYVHPIGAPHLVDPSRLLRSARRIYGERMDPLWGAFEAAPSANVVAVEDGDVIRAAGLEITALATPGHASHHHVYQLGDIAFTGDALGIRLPESAWLEIPAPPPEFDLEVWKATLERLRGLGLERVYRTHFGLSPLDVDAEIDAFEKILEDTAQRVRAYMAEDLERDAMLERYSRLLEDEAAALGIDRETVRAYEVNNPRHMSVDGIVRYWTKRAEGA